MVPSKPDQSVVAVPVSVQRNKQAVPVQRYGLKGIQHEDPFDHVTRLAASVFSVPISIISIVDNETDCLHSHHCIRAKCDLTCDFNPCRIAINFFAENDDDIFVVPDATLDPRFCQSAVVVGEPGVRFYASARLRVSSGETVGTLCVMDNKPHDLSLEDQQRLVEMAKVAIDLIEFRVHGLEAEKQKKNLELKREQLNLTLENVRDAVLLIDKKFKVVLWNTNFSLLFNYPRELLYEGADAARLIRFSEERGDLWTGNTDEITTSFRDYFAAPTNKRTEIFLKNGKILDIWCETTSGDFYIFSFRDITVPRQMARLKDELVSTVSHELRTPLTSIAGALDLVASDQSCTLSDRVVKLISIARRNSSRLIDIVNDLLELDKLQHGKLQLHKEELDLCGIVTDSVEQNQLYAEKFHVTLQTVVPDRPVMVSAVLSV